MILFNTGGMWNRRRRAGVGPATDTKLEPAMKITSMIVVVATLALAACGPNAATRATTGAATGAVVAGPVGAVAGAAVGGSGVVRVQ